MLPQFIFAMILLSLSASAMIIAYRSLKKQVALNELRNDFVANISHELKTPVATVKVALEVLQKFDLKKDKQVSEEYLEMASREADRLEELVEKVLQHQTLEGHKAPIRKETCDLNQIITSVCRAMEIPIRNHKAMLRVPEQDVPCTVLADPTYLEGILMNLIDNSLKYAGPKPEIHIRIVCAERLKQLIVQDNGPGIPEEFKQQVFDKFFRVPTGNSHNVKGYGLGLNFASQFMKQLGGSISFQNMPEGGCEFILNFPMV
jgi:signal transduction histidine kinase